MGMTLAGREARQDHHLTGPSAAGEGCLTSLDPRCRTSYHLLRESCQRRVEGQTRLLAPGGAGRTVCAVTAMTAAFVGTGSGPRCPHVEWLTVRLVRAHGCPSAECRGTAAGT